MLNILKRSLIVLCLMMGVMSFAYAQDAAQSTLNVTPLAKNISLIWDMRSGNTVVLTGEDGVLINDTKVKELAGPMAAKISEISGGKPVHFVVLTHWHFDHIGGNEMFGNAGAKLIAHENVRKRLSTEQRMDKFNMTVPPVPKAALPLITFMQGLTFHINGEDVQVMHLGPGHTDGDSIVYFHNANLIHLGDLYFNGFYPYIGIESGGSINTMISIGNKILEMIDDTTTIVPGHGAPAKKAEYAGYIQMLTAIRNAIHPQIKAGKTKEEVVASKPTQAFDAKWGHGLFTPDQFVELVYSDLSRK